MKILSIFIPLKTWKVGYPAALTLQATAGILLISGTLDKTLTENGYVTINGNAPTYHYYLQDHERNNRVTIIKTRKLSRWATATLWEHYLLKVEIVWFKNTNITVKNLIVILNWIYTIMKQDGTYFHQTGTTVGVVTINIPQVDLSLETRFCQIQVNGYWFVGRPKEITPPIKYTLIQYPLSFKHTWTFKK